MGSTKPLVFLFALGLVLEGYAQTDSSGGTRAPDALAPVITVETPVDGSVTNQPLQTVTGSLRELASLTINGLGVQVDARNRFSFGPVPLSEGSNALELIATDPARNQNRFTVSVTLDSVPPPPAKLNAITRGAEIAGGVDVMGLPGSVEEQADVQITNQVTALSITTQADTDGAFYGRIDAQNSDVLTLAVRDAAGNRSAQVLLEAPVPLARRFGVIGDSIASATHTNDMCGSGKELLNCLENRLDQQDPAWSYAAGDQPWSLGRKAGYNAAAILSAAEDGAEWKDALQQAQSLFTTETGAELINQVFIGLGSNDVCTEFGRSYDGDLASIAQHIDNTLIYLTDMLSGRDDAVILITATPDITQFRDMMYSRQHNFVFNSCQALWDLDGNAVQSEARDSLCKGELGALCQVLPGDLQSELVEMFLDSTLDKNDVDEGPCGRVLNSANSDLNRQQARDFNMALNDLMAQKVAAYNGRNGIRVLFSDALFESKVEPYMVSQLDCYHPSRAGQLRIAESVWQGFNPQYSRTDRYFFDAFDNPDKCTQEFTNWGGQCWVDGGDRKGFDSWIGSNGWYRLVKDSNNRDSHWVERAVGDVSDKAGVWVSFKNQRVNVDDEGDRVDFMVYDADGGDDREPGWVTVDAFRGAGVDAGVHNGEYYDLTPYRSQDLRIRFQTNNARSMKNGDGLQWDHVSVFAW